MPSYELGQSIPADTAHAVSVSLPTWRSNVGYEEGEKWVVDAMTTGYPRFFVHKSIAAFADDIISTYGPASHIALLFPNAFIARRCLQFVSERCEPAFHKLLSTIDFGLDTTKEGSAAFSELKPTISAFTYPAEVAGLAKQYWQHTGDGTSSRRAEFCHGLHKSGLLVSLKNSPKPADMAPPRMLRGPKRYQRPDSIDGFAKTPTPAATPAPAVRQPEESQESSRFLEERFGRNLDLGLVEKARSAIRRRITNTLSDEMDLLNGTLPPFEANNTRGVPQLEESDVFLFPCGMNAIFNAHQALLKAREPRQSINFGFPYVDTLKILQKFGPGCRFFGHASSEDLDELEKSLQEGERFMALFCEFPGNPLLTCPDLKRIRKLADQYDFAVVVDETIGTFANINVLQDADIVVSSLTKLFSGDGNVMGGAAVLNPQRKYHDQLKAALIDAGDTYWPEDVIYLERNSRDFVSRVQRVNVNSEAICKMLVDHPAVKTIYYPRVNPSRAHYDTYRLPTGGYGGLLSIVFQSQPASQAFYDTLETAKGPSLGTNFTLCSPYVLLAHYQELPWAASLGVDPYLVRVSVGLEETEALENTFKLALQAAEAALSTA